MTDLSALSAAELAEKVEDRYTHGDFEAARTYLAEFVVRVRRLKATEDALEQIERRGTTEPVSARIARATLALLRPVPERTP